MLQTWKSNKPNLWPSPELAYICGVVLGDGCLQERHYKGNRSNYLIQLSANDKEFVLAFNQALCNVIGRSHLYAVDRTKDGCYRVRGQSLTLHHYLRDLRQDFFKPMAEVFPADFIRGLADSEGWVINTKRTRRIGIALISESLLRYIQDLLEQYWKILSTTYARQPNKKPSVKKDGSLIFSKKVLYSLIIYDKISLERFAENIGFTIHRKMESLQQAILAMGKPKLTKRIARQISLQIPQLRAKGVTYTEICRLFNVGIITAYGLNPGGATWQKRHPTIMNYIGRYTY